MPKIKKYIILLLKKVWKKSPNFIRQFFIVILSSYIGKHDPQAPECPLYVLGAFASSSGLAEGARLYAKARRCEGKEVICLDITYAMHLDEDFPQGLCGVVPFENRNFLLRPGTIIVHANPPQFQLVLFHLGKVFLKNKRIIGYWAWEVEVLPKIWVQGITQLDGIEVPSSFVKKTVSKYSGTKQVTVVSHNVTKPVHTKTDFMLDGVLHCLYCFDARSGLNRKNPEGVLKAFHTAFPDGGAELTLKISGVAHAQEVINYIHSLCKKIKNVHIITDVLDRESMSLLYCKHDVYISLHRSEGYGLTIREAMLHGLHVVATGWSGNMDFMDGELTHPVPYTLIPLREEQGPLKGLKGQWAEADTDAAAKILRQLREQLAPPHSC